MVGYDYLVYTNVHGLPMSTQPAKVPRLQLRRRGRVPEADAFSAIVRLYSAMVYCTGLRITGDAHYAADVTQETFFRWLRPDVRNVR
jgi:hypothetical protein